MIDALLNSDAATLLDIVNDLVLQSRNLENVLDELAEAMHRMALIQAAPDFRDPERADRASLVKRAECLSPEDIQLYYQIAITGRRDLGLAPDPRTGLEMTLLRMLAFRPGAGDSGDHVPGSKPSAARKKATGGSNEAAKTAREAFDAMQVEKPKKDLEEEPELEFASVPEGEAVSTATIAESTHGWENLQKSLDLSGAARELARNLQLESADEKCWKFLVPDTLQHLGSRKVVQKLQSAISSRLGHAVMLDLHTATEPLKSVAAATNRAEINRMSEAQRAIEEDPTVQEIKEKFGAKLIPDSVQPIQ